MTLPNGTMIYNKVHNCRKCGQYYDTRARLECRAPAPRVGRPAKPSADAVAKPLDIENLSPDVIAVMDKWRNKP